MRPIRSAALAALLALAPGFAPAASAPADDGFSPLLERRLLLQLADDCLRTHPQMRDEIGRVRDGWLTRNAAALAQYDARYAALSKQQQADIEKRFEPVSTAWRTRLEREEAAGNGELSCTNQLVRLDSESPVPAPAPMPVAAPDATPAAESAPVPASEPVSQPEAEPAPQTEPTQG